LSFIPSHPDQAAIGETSLKERDDVMRVERATAANPSGHGVGSCAASTEEHRRGLRERTLKVGSILFGRGAAIDCLVRNISQSGACLEVESPIGVPENFRLVIGQDLERPCRVAWRSERWIGAYFVNPVSP
jgi:PilZ domain-containing protein